VKYGEYRVRFLAPVPARQRHGPFPIFVPRTVYSNLQREEGGGSSLIRKSWVAALRGRSHDSFAARDAARRCRGSSGNLPYLVFARPAKHKSPTEARKLARNGMDSLVGAWNHLYPRKATNAPHKDEADPLLADGRATVESEAAARSPFLSREKMPEAGNGTQFPFLA